MVSIHCVGDEDTRPLFDEAVAGCWADLDEIEGIFSPFRETSQVRRIAAGELSLADADPRVRVVTQACTTWRERTDGLFDPWWKGWFDPTGYVKGWAIESVAETYLAPLLGLSQAVGISAGGDVWLRTLDGADWSWQIGIADPHQRGAIIATLSLANGAVATSGTAERGLHIIDPRTGTPASSIASASVIADSLVTADMWATTAVVAGFEDLSWISTAQVRSGLLVATDGRTRRWVGSVELLFQ